jgi:hypothetical protein
VRTIPYLVKKNSKWYRKQHPACVVLLALTGVFDVVVEIKPDGHGWCVRNNGRKRYFTVPKDEMIMIALKAKSMQ